MSWVNGRQLASASDGTNTYSYIYDAAGSRIMKNVGTVNHLYFYVNGMLLMEYRYNAMGDTTDVLQYFYDANGRPHAMAYNGTVYLYVTNLQGDIVALLGMDGTISGYEYDPYGNIIASYGDIAAINPLRYRGYYYDNETGLYYLQSRYYDPVVGRFINTDDASYLGLNGKITSQNLFTYCGNNPIYRRDAKGQYWESALDIAAISVDIVEIAANPTNLLTWGALAADVASLVLPGVTGGGGVVRFVASADDLVDAAKYADDVIDAAKSIKSSKKLGKEIHKTYNPVTKSSDTFVDTSLSKIYKSVDSKLRPDAVDVQQKIIYELKPYNKAAFKRGVNQAQNYINSVPRGKCYTVIIDLYY